MDLLAKPVSPDNQTDLIIRKTLERTIARYWDDGPEGWLRFMHDELRYVPDGPVRPGADSIESTIVDVASFQDTAVRSCHGVGKTTAGASILLTASCLVPQLMVVQISPTWRQVTEIFWNEVRKWYQNSQVCQTLFTMAEKAPKMVSKISEERWFARGLASNMPGKVEGKHGKRVLLIADETKAIEDAMIEAIQGALTSEMSWRCYLSTPSTPGGKYTRFYLCFTKHRHLWKQHVIKASDSKRVAAKWVKMMADEYGPDSQIYQARVDAEFPDLSGDLLMSLKNAEQFFNDSKTADGLIAIGVDVARRGWDESVAAIWQGDVLIKLEILKEHSTKTRTTDLSRQVLALIKQYDARAVVVDDIGVGGGVTDNLSDESTEFYAGESCAVVPFIANAKPIDERKFVSIADEVLWNFAQDVKKQLTSSLVDDEKLTYQLSSYKISYTSGERISVKWPESKKDRSSDEQSPDRGDACWMGWYGARQLIMATLAESAERNQAAIEEEDLEAIQPEFSGIRDRKF